jgi:hypothetical protein
VCVSGIFAVIFNHLDSRSYGQTHPSRTDSQPQQTFAIGSDAEFTNLSLAVVDVNGDGKPDVITANYPDAAKSSAVDHAGSVSVLLGNGDGTFGPQQTFSVASGGYSMVVADLNGDGKPDIVSTNHRDKTVSVMWGNGDGTFGPQQTFSVASGGYSMVVADLNGDGKLDIVTPDFIDNSVSVLLGNGDGTFGPQQASPIGVFPSLAAVADVNGDGKPDLIAVSNANGTVSVLRGNGDGTFQAQPSFAVGFTTYAVAVADVNGDGKPDSVVAGYDTVSVLLGNGDGSLQPRQTFAVGSGSFIGSVAVADVNGDGKPDIVTSNLFSNTVSVLLGNGDGTFGSQQTVPVGSGPTAVVVADVNGDGKPDIVTPSLYTNSVSVLLGNGDGTFQPQQTFPVGQGPYSSAVADINGDGKPDIVTANLGDYTASVLLGNGDGTFQPQQTFALGFVPIGLAVADLNGDGRPDLIIHEANTVIFKVLLGNGDGTFQSPHSVAVDSDLGSLLAVADVNGDGKPDLVFDDYSQTSHSTSIGVLLGNGDGTFRPPETHAIPTGGFGAVADVNGDGKPDLVMALASSVGILLGNGDGTFTTTSPTAAVGLRNTPYLADLTGDGFSDSVVLDRSGNILFRKGLPGADNPFAPPVILNPGRPARDLTVLRTATGWAVAAADAGFDPQLSGPNHFVYTVSLYTVAADGTVTRTTACAATMLPTRIAAADLTGDGLDDLVVANSLNDSILVAFQQPDGTFNRTLALPTGEAPSDLSLVDVTGDSLPDIVVSNQASGDVSVFLNDPGHAFATSYRFRAGTSLYGLDTSGTSPVISTLEQAVSLAAGDFTGSGRNDLVVVNRGSHSFSILPNDGSGGFANPQPALTTSTNDGALVNQQPGPVVAGDFNDDGKPDLAILMKDRAEVWIFTGTGDGSFHLTFRIAAGTTPTGLNLYRNPQTGLLDLLVGDPFGDVLHLQGKGDGTFQVAGSRVSLAAQVMGPGQPTVLVANQQTDRVTVQAAKPNSPQYAPVVTLADGTQSTLAPGAVQWAHLDQYHHLLDAVVVASGGNAVLVYRNTGLTPTGQPTFAAPVSYPLGTDPVSVTIQDINGDGIPDMVAANQGSNDVSILFGSWDAAGDWVGTPGPRLASGGQGPVAVAVRDVTGPGAKPDGIPDLVVTNGQSGTLGVLPGVGQGFFNDLAPTVLNVPGNPVIDPLALAGSSGVGVIPTADGSLFGLNLNTLSVSAQPEFTSAAGSEIRAVEALSASTLVVAEAGDEVALLGFDAKSGLYVLQQTLTQLSSGLLDEPSALAVLESLTGQLQQVLVTNQGEDQVFVFGMKLSKGPGPEPPPVTPPPPPLPPDTHSEQTAPLGAPLALVVTLTADILPAGPAGASEESVGNAATVTEGAQAAAEVTAAIESGCDDEDNVAVAQGPVKDSTFGLGGDDLLRQLDFAPRPEDGTREMPVAPNPKPTESGPPDKSSSAPNPGPAEPSETPRAPLFFREESAYAQAQPADDPSDPPGSLPGLPQNPATATPLRSWVHDDLALYLRADGRGAKSDWLDALRAIGELGSTAEDVLAAGSGREETPPVLALLSMALFVERLGPPPCRTGSGEAQRGSQAAKQRAAPAGQPGP